MSEPAHSRLGPSSMHRILRCPGSAVLAETDSSEAAEEGTLGHELAYNWLAMHEEPPEDTDPDLVWAVRECVDYVRGCPGKHDMLLEHRLESRLIPDFGGTADCILVGGDALHVIDFKMGRSPVDAEGNAQLMSYLCLAREHFPHRDGVLAGSIVQPRVSRPQYTEFTVADLEDHLAKVYLAADDDERVAGSHCKWCPLLLNCDENRRWVEERAIKSFGDDGPSIERCLEILDLAPVVADMETKAKKELLKKTLNGEKVPGFKAVRQLSNRRWEDENAAFAALRGRLGLDDNDLFDRVALTPPKIEAKLKAQKDAKSRREAVKLISELCGREPGRVILAPEKSKLPEYRPGDVTFPDLEN